MVDVIFFDYWLRGTRHFKFIQEALAANGKTSLLLHTSSWREGTKDEPIEVFYEGFLCRDIAHYGYSITKALKTEKPKVVILLNQQTEDRIITRYCRLHGIKTVYLMHGVIASDTTLSSKTLNSAFGLKDRLKRFSKYKTLFKEYFIAFNQKSPLGFLNKELYTYFIGLFISPGKIIYNIWRFRDSYADFTLVYSQADYHLFTQKMGFEKDKVKVVGNYNLDELYQKKNLGATEESRKLLLQELGMPTGSKYVLYIEGGFFTPGYIIPGWSIDTISDEIRTIALTMKKRGLYLIIKLHPSSDYSDLTDRLVDIDNIVLTKNYDLALLTMHAVSVLGQSSSALRFSAVLGIPLFILSIEPLPLIFRDYIDNDFGVLVSSFNELEEKISSVQEGRFSNSPNYYKNIEYHLLPFDGKSGQRVNEHILSLLYNN